MAADHFGDGLIASVVTYGSKMLENPEVGGKFALAYIKASRQYMEGKTQRNVQLISDFTGIEKELVERVCWSFVPIDGNINVDSIMEYQQWLIENELIDKLLKSEQFIDTQFKDFALKTLSKE
jgi:hypothetical protein